MTKVNNKKIRLKDNLDPSLLKVDQEYSYQELCLMHGCDLVKGNSKISDIKELERYFAIKKMGKSILL